MNTLYTIYFRLYTIYTTDYILYILQTIYTTDYIPDSVRPKPSTTSPSGDGSGAGARPSVRFLVCVCGGRESPYLYI